VTAAAGLLTKGSLCSGYGGLDLATPGTLRFLAEVNDDATAVLKREYPHVPNLGDISAHRWTGRNQVGLLTAGFPCQPVSAAGSQRAKTDVRWLWPDVLNAIVLTRPDEVFLENVQNIVSIHQGAILAEILGGLRDARYACRWTILGACTVGAPHHRHRWFLRGRRGRRAPRAVRLINKCGAPRTGGRVLLPTPTVADGAGGPFGHRDGGLNLRSAVMLLPTLTAQPGRWGKFAVAVALWEDITRRAAPDPTVPAPKGGRRLNPALSEWMMGLPPGLVTDGVARSAALRLAGNGVVPAAAAAAYVMLAGDLS
jgi:DNA (cytosine-5)-methyltransferase 1